MKKIFLAMTLIATGPFMVQAQEETPPPSKEKRFQHHIGFQVNELVRQVFNFNDNPAVTNNPYLAIYSINHMKTGWGLRIGAGYMRNRFTNEDGITRRENDITNMYARFGVEKLFHLSQKWTAGVGLDGIYSDEGGRTFTRVNSFDSTKTTVISSSKSYGGGAMTWLRYAISEKVLLGTEASFYYRTGNFKQTIAITQRQDGGSFGQPPIFRTNTEKVDNKITEGIFRMPVVLYLIVRF